jgi:hypothetical protein
LLNLINISEKSENKKIAEVITYFKNNMAVRNQVISDVAKENKNKKAILFYQQLENFANCKTGAFLRELERNHKELICISKDKAIQASFDSMLTVIQSNFKPFI